MLTPYDIPISKSIDKPAHLLESITCDTTTVELDGVVMAQAHKK